MKEKYLFPQSSLLCHEKYSMTIIITTCYSPQADSHVFEMYLERAEKFAKNNGKRNGI